MKVSSSVRFAAPLLLCMLALSHAQEQPSLGVPVPPLGAGPWVFDTAEQHKVRVSVVRCFRHQLLLPRPYLVLTKPLRLDIQCQRAASVKIGWKYVDD